MAKPKKPRRILLVEDNIDAVRTLAFLLREEGHEVEYAINGYVAIDMARTFRPEIVFLDIGLPGLDGFEVCSRLKSEPEFARTIVVAVTGYGSDEHRVKAHAAGCDVHLVKPVDAQRLIRLIDSF